MEPKKAPIIPTSVRIKPSKMMNPPPLSESLLLPRLEPRPTRNMLFPMSERHMIPWMNPQRRMFKRMSPFRIWLNSCATTPWSWSRFNLLEQPSVMPITASLGEYQAANALMPTSLMRYTGGTGKPEAMAISDTMLSIRFSFGFWVWWLILRPPKDSAITLPPPLKELILNTAPSPTTEKTPVATYVEIFLDKARDL